MAKRLYGWAALLVVMGSLLLFALPSCQGTCESIDECGGKGSNEFCAVANGSCLTSQTVGFCKPRPKDCPNVFAQVCGCDGQQYDNACLASKAGASVANVGLCPVPCGGSTGKQCNAGFYCDYGPAAAGATSAPTCLSPSATGTCTALPVNCTMVNQPVCGCDGKTYQNACLAAAASTSVASTGACTCGGATCNAGEFCNQTVGTCGLPNPAGVCQTPPTDCKGSATSPVCGCDNKTYENACEAAKVHVSIASMGACVCGGPKDIPCEAGTYCQYTTANGCTIPGSPGTCQKIPDAASCSMAKVGSFCSCDVKKNKADKSPYDNQCLAVAAGKVDVVTLPMATTMCP